MNPERYDYPSRRRVIYGRHGMVCSSQPLAAQAGLDILKKGGNAVDAAKEAADRITGNGRENGMGQAVFGIALGRGTIGYSMRREMRRV